MSNDIFLFDGHLRHYLLCLAVYWFIYLFIIKVVLIGHEKNNKNHTENSNHIIYRTRLINWFVSSWACFSFINEFFDQSINQSINQSIKKHYHSATKLSQKLHAPVRVYFLQDLSVWSSAVWQLYDKLLYLQHLSPKSRTVTNLYLRCRWAFCRCCFLLLFCPTSNCFVTGYYVSQFRVLENKLFLSVSVSVSLSLFLSLSLQRPVRLCTN